MHRKTTIIRKDFNVNSTRLQTRRELNFQQQNCNVENSIVIPKTTAIINLDDCNNVDTTTEEIVCKTEAPPSPINRCENTLKCIYYCECGDEDQHSPVELYDSSDDDERSNNNSLISIRYDYDNKTKNCNQPTTPTNYRHTTSLVTYIKESKQQNQLKRFDYHKTNGTKIDVNHDIVEDVAKSPETRKNELCTYLKLMKPQEQQQKPKLLKNRRSVRVKNLQQNDKKTIDENFNNTNKYLPLPPPHIYRHENDFDEIIGEIMTDWKTIESNRNDVRTKRLLRARVNRNKLNWRRSNSIRSKRLKHVSLEELVTRRNRYKRQRRQYQQRRRCRLEKQQKSVILDESPPMDERCELITICTVDSVHENEVDLNNLNNGELLIRVDDDRQIALKNLINFEHDYADYDDEDDDDGESFDSSDTNDVNNVNIDDVFNDNDNGTSTKLNRNSNNQQQSNHSIIVSDLNGTIIDIKYCNNHLIVVQLDLISLWTQSQLGSILNSQNMWIPNGRIKRLILNNNDYIKKDTINSIISKDTTFAYIELWIKEHKSNIRKYPVCDIFATVYFWRHRQVGLDKKVLQLENIKGSSEHVQYVVLPNLPLIIVCWYFIDGNERKTQIRSYLLAQDYQTVATVNEFATVNHYVLSLHNIEECENLVMGCGDNRILLWNIEHGYLIANIDLYGLKPTLSTLWVKCDRGFIFIVQQCQDQQLRLIAINGLNNSWKQLHTYGPPPLSRNFVKLLNIYIENGILLAYYNDGVLCWNTQTGKPVLEDIPNNVVYMPSGKYVIIVINNERILIKHALTHFLITAQDL